jgi:hypothetical protein
MRSRVIGAVIAVQTGDAAPNASQRAVAKALVEELNGHLARLTQLSRK